MNKKISEFITITTAASADLFLINHSGTTCTISLDSVLNYIKPRLFKASVIFNGVNNIVGPCSIIGTASNVSSVQRTAEGLYTINFTTSLTDADYGVIATSKNGNGTVDSGQIINVSSDADACSLNYCKIVSINSNSAFQDSSRISVLIY